MFVPAVMLDAQATCCRVPSREGTGGTASAGFWAAEAGTTCEPCTFLFFRAFLQSRDSMLIKILKAKIHRATVTHTDVNYHGSITIDEDLLRASGLLPNEAVLVADCENGNRFETYVIHGPAGSGIIGINGAAAR